MPRHDFSAVGYLALDILGRYIDALPPPGGATAIDQIAMTVAGTAGATAVDCAILGLKGQISGRVGRDPAGDFLRSEMQKFGLDIDLVQVDDAAQTSCSMLPIRPDGSRAALYVPGTSATFLPTEADIERIVDARVVHLGGTGLLDAFDGAPSLALLQRARQNGCITVFDLIQATPQTVAKVAPLLPFIDYFVPSIHEAAAMAGMTDPGDVARWFKARGVKNAILTLEGDGVYVDPEVGEAFHLPAHRIEVIDTTGCGDSFTAGIIVGIVKGWNIRQSAGFANTVAAHVAQGLGSQGILSSFDATKSAMRAWPLKGG